jgi:hypothetical protein
MTEMYASGEVRICYLNGKLNKQLPVQADAAKPFLLLLYVAGPGLLLKREAGGPVTILEMAGRLQLLWLHPADGRLEGVRREQTELFAIQCSEAFIQKMLKDDS